MTSSQAPTARCRRNRKRTFTAACLLAAALLAPSCSKTDTRPNILFLLTDDQRADTLSSVGHPVIQTPNLDHLAQRGVLFTEAHVTDPICAPSRTTFFTGQYERVHRVGFSSQHKMTEAQWAQTYPALLRQSGYYTGFVGKFGVQQYAFNSREKFDFWRGHDNWARFFPKPRENCAIYRDATADIITPIMGESVERFLESLPGDAPFCLSVSFSAPHGSISTSMDFPDGDVDNLSESMSRPANLLPRLADHPVYGSLYRDRAIEPPATYTEDTGRYLPTSIYNPRVTALNYSYDYEPARLREHQIRYYQLVHGLDVVVGQIAEMLEQRGLADNTVIIFTSDHGLLLGDYGMGGKALLYDLTTRVPLIIHDPRLPEDRRGKRLDQLVSSADIAPTILSLAGVEPPAGMQGRDLMPLMNGTSTEWREEIFTENLFIGRQNPFSEGVRTRRWKYIRHFMPQPDELVEKTIYRPVLDLGARKPDHEQLFDLRADPGETTNLAGDAAHQETLERMRKRGAVLAAKLVADARRQTFESEAALPDGVRLSGKWQSVVWGTPENPKPGRPKNLSVEQLASLPDEVSLGADEPVKFTHMQWGDCRLRFDLKGPARVLVMGLYDVVALASEAGAAAPGPDWSTYEISYHAPRWEQGAIVAKPRLRIDRAGTTVRELSALPLDSATPPEDQVNQIGEQFGPLRIEAVDAQSAFLREVWVAPLEPARQSSGQPWRDMFDGKTLNGWSINGGDAEYRVENGEIIGATVTGSANTFLISDKDYDNFEFSVEVHGSVEFNAGLQFRSQARGGRGRTNRTFGYQCEIDPSDRRWTAGVYDEARRGWLHPMPYLPDRRMPIEQDRWHEFRILADGPVIKTFLDGKLITHIYDSMTRRGYFGLQVHGTKQERTMEIRWRNVRIRELD